MNIRFSHLFSAVSGIFTFKQTTANHSYIESPYSITSDIIFQNTSPNNTWVFEKEYGKDAFCEYDSCHLVLEPGGKQWVAFSNNNALEILTYHVCDTTGPAAVTYWSDGSPKCAVYSGAKIDVTATPNQVSAVAIEGTVNTIEVKNQDSIYQITATTTSPPTCDLPYPTQYKDGKRRTVNLSGASSTTPQFPYMCDLAYFASLGVNTVRFIFNWGYLQTDLSQISHINWMPGGYAYQLEQLTNAWTAAGYKVILTMDNSMKFGYCVIGAPDCWITQEQYANLWGELAQKFANNSKVIFGLMNKPDVNGGDMYDGTTLVLNNQNAAANAIRHVLSHEPTALPIILYSGNGFSRMDNWNSSSYGKPNNVIFLPENINDTRYEIEVSMYYPNTSTALPEEGCIASENNEKNECINIQSPVEFLTWMNQTGIAVSIGETGGINSSECITCINVGTRWLLEQRNITSIGLWTAGQIWLTPNGSTSYPLYLAPIYNVSQWQMTKGFQNVTNPITDEKFLIPPVSIFTSEDSHTKNNYSLPSFLISFLILGGATIGICIIKHLQHNLFNNKITTTPFPKRKAAIKETIPRNNIYRLFSNPRDLTQSIENPLNKLQDKVKELKNVV